MVDVRELQLIELDILKDIDRVCRKHNLIYYLGEGTLLGAIRHEGFIPWDDDIDILMPRDDYEKFLKVASKEISNKYEIQHFTTIKNYWSPFIKVRLLNHDGKWTQNHISHLTKNNGPLLDIFPLDTVPKNESLGQSIQAFYFKLNRALLSHKLGLKKVRTFKARIIKILSYFLSVKGMHKVLDKTFKKYNNKNNEYMINLGSYYHYKKQTLPMHYYGKPRMVKFEDGMYPVPTEAEKVLTSIYGDYMILPPIEKRVIKHKFEDFDH